MRYMFSRFLRAEDGAITVDWIVMTAAVVGLAATGGASILSATQTLSGNVQTEVSGKTAHNGD